MADTVWKVPVVCPSIKVEAHQHSHYILECKLFGIFQTVRLTMVEFCIICPCMDCHVMEHVHCYLHGKISLRVGNGFLTLTPKSGVWNKGSVDQYINSDSFWITPMKKSIPKTFSSLLQFVGTHWHIKQIVYNGISVKCKLKFNACIEFCIILKF